MRPTREHFADVLRAAAEGRLVFETDGRITLAVDPVQQSQDVRQYWFLLPGTDNELSTTPPRSLAARLLHSSGCLTYASAWYGRDDLMGPCRVGVLTDDGCCRAEEMGIDPRPAPKSF